MVQAVTLNDPPRTQLPWLPVTACAGRRAKFVLRVRAAAARSDVVFYDSLSMARAHFLFGRARGKGVVGWMHGTEVWEGARPDRIETANRLSLLLTNTEYTRDRAARLHPDLKRAQVCWLGTEEDSRPESVARPLHPPTAMILSRIDGVLYKGHRELVAVWPDVTKRVPGARLVIVGSGPGLSNVRRLVAASAACGQIDITGYVEEECIDELWRDVDLLAMPSIGEGFGLVYIEAMRRGIPVIASRQDGGQEVNVDGVTGFNVDRDQPSALVEALVIMLGDGPRSRVMGSAAQRRWQAHFTFGAFRQRFFAVLERGGYLERSGV